VKLRKHAVRLLRAAEEDFTEIVTYIAAQRPNAAEALAQKIEKNLTLLAPNPYLGRIPNEPELADLGYRYLVVENYLIYYVREERTVFVHRIIHGPRDYRGLL
jgi:toxin ParE1/3/4